MKKSVLIVLFLFGCSVDHSENDIPDASMPQAGSLSKEIFTSTQELIQQLSRFESAILDLECTYGPDERGKITSSRGTAAKISENEILTVNHVVATATRCQLYSGGVFVANTGVGKLAFTTPFKVDDVPQDVAIVSNIFWNQNWENIPVVPVATSPQISLGKRLCIMSLPYDINSVVQYSCGDVASLNVPIPPDRMSQFTATYIAAHGSSGAPIFDDTMEIIAVNVAGYDNGVLDLAYAIPLQNREEYDIKGVSDDTIGIKR